MQTVRKSWYDDREWFVYDGASYRGEVRYLPGTMQWRAHPWRASGRLTGQVFDEMEQAISFACSAVP